MIGDECNWEFREDDVWFVEFGRGDGGGLDLMWVARGADSSPSVSEPLLLAFFGS